MLFQQRMTLRQQNIDYYISRQTIIHNIICYFVYCILLETHARTHARTNARSHARTHTHTHTHTLKNIYLIYFSPFAAFSLCGVARLAETFPCLTVSRLFLAGLPCFQLPSDSVFDRNFGILLGASPPHIHVHNCSDDFCFIYSFNVPELFQHSPYPSLSIQP